jgi:ornithine carbamoyltransferase
MSARAEIKRTRVFPIPAARRKPGSSVRHYLSVLDLSRAEIVQLLDQAEGFKRDRASGGRAPRPLEDKHVALLFEKPSLRTRSTFTIAVRELGGDVIEPPPDVALGGRETVRDVARNLERWVAACVVRTYAQRELQVFAAAATRMHVINALTDEEHPCQVLADMMTLRERVGTLAGRTLAFVGDGNNVATSLAHAGALLGLRVRIASPKGYELSEGVVRAFTRAAQDGAALELMTDPRDAVRDADAVYTDAWTSMGQEAESARREHVFRSYQVNAELMAAARTGAIFMHCLPAHRGSEVTDEVMDSSASVVFDQAENRLHTQKALLGLLMA